MSYVLVLVTIFSTAHGITSDTRFHLFASQSACESARDGIERGVRAIVGQMGREVFAECYVQGGAPEGG